jgi:hypothetical protein
MVLLVLLNGTKIEENAQFNSTQLRTLPVVEFVKQPGLIYTILLLEIVSKTALWLVVNGIEKLEYLTPTNPGRYTFFLFSNDSIPVIEETRNFKNIPASVFGKLVDKVSFYIGGLSALPIALQQTIPRFDDLDIAEIENYCKIYPEICTEAMWQDLARKRISLDPEVWGKGMRLVGRLRDVDSARKLIDSIPSDYIYHEWDNQIDDIIDIIELTGSEILFSKFLQKARPAEKIEFLGRLLHSSVAKDQIELLKLIVSVYESGIDNFDLVDMYNDILIIATDNNSNRILRYIFPKFTLAQIEALMLDHVDDLNNVVFLKLALDKGVNQGLITQLFDDNENLEIIKLLLQYQPTLAQRINNRYDRTNNLELLRFFNQYPITEDKLLSALENFADANNVRAMAIVLEKPVSQATFNAALQIAIDADDADDAISLLRSRGAVIDEEEEEEED